MAKIEIFKDKKKEYRARLKSRNGKILFTTEGYKSKVSATKAIMCIYDIMSDGNTKVKYITK